MLQAGFHNFSGKSLGNFDGLGNAATFGDETGNIRACSQETAVFETLDAHSNGNFFHVREVLLPFHGQPFLRDIITASWCPFAGVCKASLLSNGLIPGAATNFPAVQDVRGAVRARSGTRPRGYACWA